MGRCSSLGRLRLPVGWLRARRRSSSNNMASRANGLPFASRCPLDTAGFHQRHADAGCSIVLGHWGALDGDADDVLAAQNDHSQRPLELKYRRSGRLGAGMVRRPQFEGRCSGNVGRSGGLAPFPPTKLLHICQHHIHKSIEGQQRPDQLAISADSHTHAIVEVLMDLGGP